jgi:hypothetical protein
MKWLCIGIRQITLLAMAALAALQTPGKAEVLYYDDFEAYPLEASIDGRGDWITSGAAYPWYVHGANVDQAYGKFLKNGQGTPNPQPNGDYAILHVRSNAGFTGLKVGFDYLLQPSMTAQIDVSPDLTHWTNVTSDFNLVPQTSNSVTWTASANLASRVCQAGLEKDLYLRFMDWNPTGSGNWNWFAIDNLKIENSPAPRTVSFCGETWNVAKGLIGTSRSSNSAENAWLDSQDRLHLRIKANDPSYSGSTVVQVPLAGAQDQPYSASSRPANPHGYGRYELTVANNSLQYLRSGGPALDLDPRVCFAFYLRQSDAHEIDVELSRWGDADTYPNLGNFGLANPPAPTPTQFRGPEDISLPVPLAFPLGQQAKLAITWQKDYIRYDYEAAGQHHSCTTPSSRPGNDFPAPDATHVAMSLWMSSDPNLVPLQNDQEVIVEKFAFRPMSEVKDATFSSGDLASWTVSGPGTGRVAEDPRDESNGVCELTTTSSESVSQAVDTLPGPFDLSVDYQFMTTAGWLDVCLDGRLVGSAQAPSELADGWTTLRLPIDDPGLWALSGTQLALSLRGDSGARALLDNVEIVSRAVPEPPTVVALVAGLALLLTIGWQRRELRGTSISPVWCHGSRLEAGIGHPHPVDARKTASYNAPWLDVEAPRSEGALR